MIRHVRHHEIDKDKWNLCIKRSINGQIYAYTWFLDIVAEEWDGLVENDYERIFPLVRKRKLGIDYLYQPAFTQQLGVFSMNLLSGEVTRSFLEAIPDMFRFAEINLNTLNKVPPGFPQVEEWLTHELDLIGTYESVRKDYSDNLRRNIRKAEHNGLQVVKNIKPEEVIRIFRAHRGRSIRNLADGDYHRLRRLVYLSIFKGMGEANGVITPENELCAGAIFLKSHRKAVFFFSGVTPEARSKGAMSFLIDHYIREHCRQHLTLDFEGSNDPNLARFYRSFGSKECHYPHLVINRLPLYLRLGLKFFQTVRSIRSGISGVW
ncbi:MAG: GNAT family N-acetyltransferase [Bacteroidales bacterium]|nr:GNAT family N-acetyltransferase [Bacteroidales bacterium]